MLESIVVVTDIARTEKIRVKILTMMMKKFLSNFKYKLACVKYKLWLQNLIITQKKAFNNY